MVIEGVIIKNFRLPDSKRKTEDAFNHLSVLQNILQDDFNRHDFTNTEAAFHKWNMFASVDLEKHITNTNFVQTLYANFVTLGVLTITSIIWLNGKMTIGAILSTIMLTNMLQDALETILEYFKTTAFTSVSISRLNEIDHFNQ